MSFFCNTYEGPTSVASKGLILHQNCAHFACVARGRWAQARTGISCSCTQKLLYQRNRGSSRGISRNGQSSRLVSRERGGERFAGKGQNLQPLKRRLRPPAGQSWDESEATTHALCLR